MAVTFTSHGYDTTSGNPYTEIAWAEAHPYIGSAQYGVRSGNDWKVTAVAGADRTVSIAAGFGWGSGVTDKTTENETIQLDPITSGSRWDLIVARRDWTPTAGETKFMKINGGATIAIPGGRLQTPGGIDDQPLALVQVTAGQTQPTVILDLRCWATNGGVVARHGLAKSYLNRLGTAVYIDGVLWRYVPGLNDVPEWVSGDNLEETAYGIAGYSITGKIYREPLDVKGGPKIRVTLDLNFERTGGDTPANYVKTAEWGVIGTILPTGDRGPSPTKYLPVAVVGGGNLIDMFVALNTSTGQLSIRAIRADHSIQNGAVFTLNLTYYI